jgi:hypothetical protein
LLAGTPFSRLRQFHDMVGGHVSKFIAKVTESDPPPLLLCLGRLAAQRVLLVGETLLTRISDR